MKKALFLTIIILSINSILHGQLQNIAWTNTGNCSNTSTVKDVDIATSNILYSTGDFGKIYKSTNGGNSWNVIYTLTTPSGASAWGQKISFKDANNGAIIVDTDDLYTTTNGGSSWVNRGGWPGNWQDIHYIKNSNIIIAVGWNYIHRSTNNGLSFSQVANIGSDNMLDVFVLSTNQNYVWAGGVSGDIYRSTDTGGSWTLISQIPGFHTVRTLFFIDSQNGWAATDGGLFKTSNGGSTWSQLSSVGNSQGWDVHFNNVNEGYYSSSNRLYHTDDGGASFVEIEEVFDNKPSNITGSFRYFEVVEGTANDILYGTQYHCGSIVKVEYNCNSNSNSGTSDCDWIGYIHDQKNGIRNNNEENCDFIDYNSNNYAFLNSGSNNLWASFATTSGISIFGYNSIDAIARVFNNSSGSGDVELWVYGSNNTAKVVFSNNQSLTRLGTDDSNSVGLSSLVQSFNTWKEIRLEINDQSKFIQVYLDNVWKGTRYFSRNFGTIRGLKVTHKGAGYLSDIQIRPTGSSSVLYQETFNECSSSCNCTSILDMNLNSVPSGSWQTNQRIYSNGDVNGNSNVEFRAGNCIELLPEFYVASGGVFEANIGPCDNSGGTNNSCFDPSQVANGFCNSVYQPVCGCNNVTYSNSCEADIAGLLSYTNGTCQLNNTCNLASTLYVDSNCNYTLGDNTGATPSGELPVPLCPGFGSGNDLWYKVQVPSNGSLTLEMFSAGGPTDFVLEAYSGTCGNLTRIDCDDDDGSGNFPLLNVSFSSGAIIYIRVWEYANDLTGQFYICAF